MTTASEATMDVSSCYDNADGRVVSVAPYGRDNTSNPLAVQALGPLTPPPSPPLRPYNSGTRLFHASTVQRHASRHAHNAYTSGDTSSDIEHDDDSESDFSSIHGFENIEERAGSLPPPKPDSLSGGSAKPLSKPHPFNATVFDVDRSHFIGDTYGGGDIVAQLIPTHHEAEPKNIGPGLFRWMYVLFPMLPYAANLCRHLQSHIPSFDAFIVSQTPHSSKSRPTIHCRLPPSSNNECV